LAYFAKMTAVGPQNGTAKITQGPVEGFKLMGVGQLVVKVLVGFRMFGLRSLEFGAFPTPFMSLSAFILEPDLQTGLERFFGRPT